MAKKAIKEAFGSFEQFKKEFSQAAVSVEGSGSRSWGSRGIERCCGALRAVDA